MMKRIFIRGRSTFFLSGLLHYKQGEKQSGIEEMKNAIQIFEWVGSENLANNYKKDFERFVR